MKNADMLIKLYDLPDVANEITIPRNKGIEIRIATLQDRDRVLTWVGKNFSQGWLAETTIAFNANPVTCMVALAQQDVIGFCCYDTSALGFCGPVGVDANYRKGGIGRALLLSALHEMKRKGYGYAVMGWVQESQFSFYEKTVNAVEIPNSFPGIYKDRIESGKTK